MKLKDLTPDKRNANKGSAKGQKMIVSSIQRSGVGRSIVADKEGRVIGGNKTLEAMAEVFGVDVEPIIVRSDGTRPLIHIRENLDLDDPNPNNPARQLAYADNFTSFFSFDLDPAVTMADMEAGFDFEAIEIHLPDLAEMLDGATSHLLSQPPSLDELENEYGEPGERDFWPFIKVQVSPEIMERWNKLMASITETEDEAKKIEIILDSVNVALFGS